MTRSLHRDRCLFPDCDRRIPGRGAVFPRATQHGWTRSYWGQFGPGFFCPDHQVAKGNDCCRVCLTPLPGEGPRSERVKTEGWVRCLGAPNGTGYLCAECKRDEEPSTMAIDLDQEDDEEPFICKDRRACRWAPHCGPCPPKPGDPRSEPPVPAEKLVMQKPRVRPVRPPRMAWS